MIDAARRVVPSRRDKLNRSAAVLCAEVTGRSPASSALKGNGHAAHGVRGDLERSETMRCSEIMLGTAAVLLGMSGLCWADSVLPQADGTIYWHDANRRLTVYSDSWAASVRPPDPSNHDEFRAAIEFPLSSVPSGLVTATLGLNVRHLLYAVSGSQASVYAYPGNGSINTGDYDATFSYGPFSEVRYLVESVDLPLLPGWSFDLHVDVLSAVQFAQDQHWAYVGFMISGEGSEYFQMSLGTLESSQFGRSGRPAILDFTVPEPGTLGLLAIGGLALIRRKTPSAT